MRPHHTPCLLTRSTPQNFGWSFSPDILDNPCEYVCTSCLVKQGSNDCNDKPGPLLIHLVSRDPPIPTPRSKPPSMYVVTTETLLGEVHLHGGRYTVAMDMIIKSCSGKRISGIYYFIYFIYLIFLLTRPICTPSFATRYSRI